MQTVPPLVALAILSLMAISLALWGHAIWSWANYGWPLSFRLRRAVPWLPVEAVIVIVVVLFVVAGVSSQTAGSEAGKYTLRQVQLHSLSQIIELALIPGILSLWHVCTWSDFGLHRREWTKDLGIGIWGVLLAILPVHLCQIPLQSLRDQSPHALLELLRSSAGDGQTWLWILFQVVVLAPLVEELVFRVILQGALSRDTSPVLAVSLTSAAFVCVHQPVDWAPLLPLAVILGYVYHRRQSYLAVVVIHSVFNALNLGLALSTLKPSLPPP